MKYLSVCSGIEAATVAWHPLGWQAAAYSEIEPFPSAVLAHHYPDVPNVGDMTKFKEWSIESGSVDLLVGGTPCQSFSVAGLRKGLADPRGNLALVYCGILDHLKPRWFVWENVPGVLSSGGGRDFGSFLGAVAELGYGFAYRVLDAQYFGVAQRRRRVFVVGHLGDWRPAAKVLFERESLRRDSAPSRKAGERVAPTIAGCSNGGGSNGPGRDIDSVESLQPYPIANTLTARMHKGINSTVDEGQTPVVTHSLRGEGFDASEDGTGRGTPLVPVAMRESGQGYWMQDDIAGTLRAEGEDRPSRPSHVIGVPVAFHPKQDPISIHRHCIGRAPESGPQGKEYLMDGSAYCMDSRGQPQAVAFHPTQDPISSTEVCHSIGANENATAAVATMRESGQGYWVQDDIAGTIDANMGMSGHASRPAVIKQQTMQVRRLTPTECERLQGFPDNYTAIPWHKKPIEDCPDGPRYKALGNSMAVPVMAWIGKRINELEA